MNKQQLRLKLQKDLLEMNEKQRNEKSRKACRNLIQTPQFQNASVIMVYLSLPYEVDTAEIILSAWQSNKIIAVPKISWQQRHMIPVQINTLETGFSTDIAGLRNPTSGAPVPFEEIDLVITPALGFDDKGNRLGRGGSYYDRFFANKQISAVKCGLAFTEQIVEQIPVTETDVEMDFLVTDEKVIYVNDQQQGG